MKRKYAFSFRIFLPALLTMVLFVISIFWIVIPSFEKNMMDGKRQTIYELTQTACSILEKYNAEVDAGDISLSDAQEMAAEEISSLRYGDENKDYFWITDMHPIMIRHPYRPDLNGQALNNFEDPKGKKLFVEFVNVVNANGEGYVDYMWQWKDDSTRIVPKLSYVRGFPEWGWIVGTGIYIEDVKTEIARLERNLIYISLVILGVLIILLAFIIYFNSKTERARIKAEEELKRSRERYRTLVEASSEGTILLLGKDVFANKSFLKISGLSESELNYDKLCEMLKLEEQFNISDHSFDTLKAMFTTPQRIELMLDSFKEGGIRVLLNISLSKIMDQEAIVIIVRPLEDAEASHTGDYSSLVLPQLRIASFVTTFTRNSRFLDVNPYLIELLGFSSRTELLSKNINEFFVSKAEQQYFLKTLLSKKSINDYTIRVKRNNGSEFMATISAAIFEDKHNNETVCSGAISPVTHLYEKWKKTQDVLAELQMSSVNKADLGEELVNSVRSESNIEVLTEKYRDFTLYTGSLIKNGIIAERAAKLLSDFSQALVYRLNELAIEKLGQPPCDFAYITFGSVGRGEQTFATDQDNAIIFADGSEDDMIKAKEYFLGFGKQVSEWLNQIGYKLCEGDMMASNPKWCVSLYEWKKYFSTWINTPDAQNMMEISVFFDFEVIYGNESFGTELREFIDEVSHEKAIFYFNLAQSILHYKAPLNLLGNIVSTSNETGSGVDIKLAMMPLVMLPRIYAIYHKKPQVNTFERIKALSEAGVFSSQFSADLHANYNYLMTLRLKNQLDMMDAGVAPGNLINMNKLTDLDKNALQHVFSRYKLFQNKIKTDFQAGQY